MGGGNTKPVPGDSNGFDADNSQQQNLNPQSRNPQGGNYSNRSNNREEGKQNSQSQARPPKPGPSKAPLPQDDDDDEGEEGDSVQPLPTKNSNMSPGPGGNSNRSGNSPMTQDKSIQRPPGQVTPKSGGESFKLGNDAPRIPQGKSGGQRNKAAPIVPYRGVPQGKASSKAVGQGQLQNHVVELQKITRKSDPGTMFNQFVKGIKSNIQYPVRMQDLKTNRQCGSYFFTSNTNVFYGLDEEKLIVVPLNELIKVYDALDSAESGDCVDESFPSTVQALTDNPANQQRFKNIIFKKFSELAPKEGAPIIQKTNNPASIDPGDLRDLAFQSVLGILTENEAVVTSNFPDINESSHKIYAVWLNDGGEWECFIIDELFPFDKGVEDWAFTKTKTNVESWILIMEKAFAKMYGCYEKLERGHPAHFLHDITGAPYDHFYFDDDQKCWDFLEAINGELTVVVAMSKNPATMIDNENMLNKAQSYAYKVQGQVEIMTPMGKERLIMLKSPWGFASWKGEWAKDSKRWTPELMNELNPGGYKNEHFWISIKDFVKMFGVGFIYTLFSDYLQCSLRLDQSRGKNYSLLLINIPGNGGHGFLKISQKDRRYFENDQKVKYEYSVLKMMLAKVDSKLKLQTFVGGIFDKGRDCELEVVLEPGDYLAYIEVDWLQNEIQEFVFSSYHETNMIMYELECDEDQSVILSRFLKCYFNSSADAQSPQDYSSVGKSQLQRSIEYVYGYLCFYYVNTSNDYTLEETVRMNSLFGLEICPPYENDFEFVAQVPHNSDALVFYRTVTEDASAYHYKQTVWSVIYPDLDDELLSQFVIEKATSFQRRKSAKGGELDVLIFTYDFEGGFCMYYLNKTPYIYEEVLTFELFNLVDFTGDAPTVHNIYIHPSKGYLIKYKVEDPTTPYNYSIRLKYRLVDPLSIKTKLQEQNEPGEMKQVPGGNKQGQPGSKQAPTGNRQGQGGNQQFPAETKKPAGPGKPRGPQGV